MRGRGDFQTAPTPHKVRCLVLSSAARKFPFDEQMVNVGGVTLVVEGFIVRGARFCSRVVDLWEMTEDNRVLLQ